MNSAALKSELSQFTGTGNYYKYIAGTKLTDGAKYLAEKAECFWLLDIIASYQLDERLIEHRDFQVWKLKAYERHGDEMVPALITCDDGNGNVILEQKIEATDFPLEDVTLWFQRGVIFLPSEY